MNYPNKVDDSNKQSCYLRVFDEGRNNHGNDDCLRNGMNKCHAAIGKMNASQ